MGSADLRLLMVLASPRMDATGAAMPPLDMADEVWRLRAAIERSQVVPNGAAAPWAIRILRPQGDDRLRRLLGRGYRIVHFGCHGGPDGLVMENDMGVGELVSGTTLADWMRPGDVKLAVISACNSEQIGKLLYERGAASCVVATKTPIRDEEARHFCAAFYGELALGQRRDIAAALAQGRRQLTRPNDLVHFGDTSWAPDLDLKEAPMPGQDGQGGQALFPFQMAAGFIGRHEELEIVARWLDSPKPVMAVSGLRRTGKTCFAIYSALRLGQDFQARVFVSAKDSPGLSPAQVLATLQRELRIKHNPSIRPQDDIASLLNDRDVFLILDSVDLLEEPIAQALAEALQGLGPSCISKVLLTTHLLKRSPLTTAPVVLQRDVLRLGALGTAESVRLLFESGRRATSRGLLLPVGRDLRDPGTWSELRNGAGLPPFWTAPMVGVLDELAGLAFRHPPLLEHVGALVATGGSSEADQGYDEARMRLATADREIECDRNGELETCRREFLSEKIALLRTESPEAVTALHAAIPFAGAAREEHLRYVTLGRNKSRDKGQHALFHKKALQPAVESQLLGERDGRYELPPPVRAYLQQHPHEDASKHPRRHAEALLELPSIDPGWHNISSALNWLAQQVRGRLTEDDGPLEEERLLVAYAKAWVSDTVRGRLSVDWLDAARLAAERLNDTETEALTLEAKGGMYWDQARRHYEEAARLYHEAKAPIAEASVYRILGDIARARSSSDPSVVEQGLSYYRQALSLFEARDDRGNQSQILESMAQLHFLRSEERMAHACIQKANILRGQNSISTALPESLGSPHAG